jgi:hypothetical protein
MITMGSPYFVLINANEIIPSWYLLGAVLCGPPRQVTERRLADHAGGSPLSPSVAVRRLRGLFFVCCLYSVDVMQNCEGSLS